MDKITRKDVESAVLVLVRAANSVGFDTDAGLTLQAGSPTNGRAWRVFDHTGGGSLPFIGTDRGYVGWTAREAYDTIHAVARALFAVADLKVTS